MTVLLSIRGYAYIYIYGKVFFPGLDIVKERIYDEVVFNYVVCFDLFEYFCKW
jgi:hypothetical protein